MKIGFFTKLGYPGGSEHRCCELSSSVLKFSNHEAYIFAEGNINKELYHRIHPGVKVFDNVLKSGNNVDLLYEMDHILVLNTDSQVYTTLDYWEGKSENHSTFVDLTRIKSMSFLFNFIVSPARHLTTIETKCKNLKIFTANDRFYNEIDDKDKHVNIRHIPKMKLESPIDPDTLLTYKVPSKRIRIGKHSTGISNKWNKDHKIVIEAVNKRVGADKIFWDFMGCNSEIKKTIESIDNVICRDVYSKDVATYLSEIDIFFFFLDYKRNEPGSRAVSECLISQTAIIATNDGAGNTEQVKHGINGYLFKTTEECIEYLVHLINNPALINIMGEASYLHGQRYTSHVIFEKFLKFIEE